MKDSDVADLRAEIQLAKSEALAEMSKLELPQTRWTAVMLLLIMFFALIVAIPKP